MKLFPPFGNTTHWLNQTTHGENKDNPSDWSRQKAEDWGAVVNTPVYAGCDGKIVNVSNNAGVYLTLDPGPGCPFWILYVHCRATVANGAAVKRGQQIAVTTGTYGHLHLAMKNKNYTAPHPEPISYLERSTQIRTKYPAIANVWFKNNVFNWGLFEDLQIPLNSSSIPMSDSLTEILKVQRPDVIAAGVPINDWWFGNGAPELRAQLKKIGRQDVLDVAGPDDAWLREWYINNGSKEYAVPPYIWGANPAEPPADPCADVKKKLASCETARNSFSKQITALKAEKEILQNNMKDLMKDNEETSLENEELRKQNKELNSECVTLEKQIQTEQERYSKLQTKYQKCLDTQKDEEPGSPLDGLLEWLNNIFNK